jgi:Ion channel
MAALLVGLAVDRSLLVTGHLGSRPKPGRLRSTLVVCMSVAKAILRRVPRGEKVLPSLLIGLSSLMFIAWPLADIGILERPFVGVLLIFVVLCGLLALGGTGWLAWLIMPLGVVLLSLQIAELVGPSGDLINYVDATAGLFVLVLCLVLLLGIFRLGRITVYRIVSAVIVYLLIALLFSLLFDLVERLSPNAFTSGLGPSGPAPPGSRFFYLSVITLTSVGFGDMTPMHPVARTLVMMEAIMGQMYTAILLAWLVSLQVAHRQADGPVGQ